MKTPATFPLSHPRFLILIGILLLGSRLLGHAARPVLLPSPQSVAWRKGHFRTDRPFRIENHAKRQAIPVLQVLPGQTQHQEIQTKRVVRLELLPETTGGNPEAYRLEASRDTLLVQAAGRMGFLRAAQTMRQLQSSRGIACCLIEDRPAFAWRGVMLDVSRHFFSVEFLKKQIDVLSSYKLNRLHLHLTDAAGWRMEIKRYPLLTAMGAWRTDSLWKEWWNNGERHYASSRTPGAYGGYYTQEELRELVAYAAERGMTIVPEIEMPAHSEEVLTAYPELSCTHEPYKQADFCPGNEETFRFLKNVLTEVMQVFPSEYIHVGGDEAGKASWKDCPLCQKRMKELQTDRVDDLQGYLMRRMGEFLGQHGRKMLGWDEIASPGLPRGTAVMVWRDAQQARQAAEWGCDVVMSPGAFCYLDSYQDAPPRQPEAIGGYLPLEKVYAFSPTNGLQDSLRSRVLGIQGNLWTEYIASERQVEYMLYPRVLALAETGWRGTEAKDFRSFRERAAAHTGMLRSQRAVAAFDLRHEVGERPETRSTLRHKALGAKVAYAQPYHPYYASTGPTALTDGLRGGWAFKDGRWQGFISKERFDVTVDLGRDEKIRSVACDFMQACGAEIYYPSAFRVSVSTDGQRFSELSHERFPFSANEQQGVRTLCWKGRAVRARYIRIQAMPAERGGWVFTDEIVVR